MLGEKYNKTTNNNNKPLFSVYQHWSLFIQINDQENVSWSYATARCLCDIIYELFCKENCCYVYFILIYTQRWSQPIYSFCWYRWSYSYLRWLSSSNEEQNNFPIKTAICKKTCSPFSNHAFVFVRLPFRNLTANISIVPLFRQITFSIN